MNRDVWSDPLKLDNKPTLGGFHVTKYSNDFKVKIISDYLAGAGITDIAAYQKNQYQIRDAELSAFEQNLEKK